LVALKLVNTALVTDSHAQERLLDEGILAEQLRHPNIVPVLEVGETQGYAYITMELVTQATLAQHMQNSKTLPIAEALGITRDIALALQHVHRHGLIHRDIKPANIFIGNDEKPARLGDFGIALATHHGAMGQGIGPSPDATPRYMSPEQAMGGSLNGSSDQYSLGAVLYEMLTGQVPHNASDLETLIVQIKEDTPPALGLLQEQLPRSVELLVNKLMHKQPKRRYGDCNEVVQVLDRITAALCHSTTDGPSS
jgi:serine/threonine-protein kinase